MASVYQGHPHRTGFVDALAFRPCKSPYPVGWGYMSKTAAYIKGYMEGEVVREKLGLKPLEEFI